MGGDLVMEGLSVELPGRFHLHTHKDIGATVIWSLDMGGVTYGPDLEPESEAS